ncbi:VPS10 domain-containing protein [Alicyclobacillus fodiniaquatilis]|uniref:LppP/LprE family lipoprotein n=1 Tax=Alicyclobacillus fodiniaquatilis TaxID=1661150 RepID=A0ABW4JIU6_9BACL
MNKRLALIPITVLVLLTLAGCTTSPDADGAKNNWVKNSTTNASHDHALSNSTGATNNNASNTSNTTNSAKVSVGSTTTTTSQANYASEIALIKSKGYALNRTIPNATVKTSSGAALSAWIGVSGRDGHSQFVFFFLNGKYLGTDTAKPSVEITSVTTAENGVAVTYPVYKKNDSFANPTGTPVTITYTWNGSKLVPNKPYPKQFQASNTTNASGSARSGSGVQALNTLYMVNSNTGWATGLTSVWLTRDGGVDWNNVSPQGFSHLKNLQMKVYGLDAKDVWLAVNDSASISKPIAIYHTTNGGKSWVKQKFTGTGEPISFHFQDANYGWIALMQGAAAGSEKETIYQTSDGGNSWNKVSTTTNETRGGLPFGGDKTGVSFINNNNHGWATGFTPVNGLVYLYQTTDDGKTWNLQHVTVPSQFTSAEFMSYPPIFFSQQDGILPVSDGSTLLIYRTTDGGKTWISGKEVQSIAKNQAIQAWSFPTMNDALATDGNKMFVTTDGGQAWSSFTPNISLRNVSVLTFTSSTQGWALMTSGALYHTNNGGHTWIKEYPVQQ